MIDNQHEDFDQNQNEEDFIKFMNGDDKFELAVQSQMMNAVKNLTRMKSVMVTN